MESATDTNASNETNVDGDAAIEHDGLMKEGAVTGPATEGSTNTVRKASMFARIDMTTFCSVIGNVLEWYDFAVFGYFSDEIGRVFFPSQDGDLATMESFAVFGGAFLMRPVGGVVLGAIGDRYGPKQALIISIFLMAFPTFAMGCLPSYDSVGAIAIVLLVAIRLLQGFSVGGQLMSSLCYTVETNDPSQWGFYGSFVMAAANFGTLLGALAGSVLDASLTQDQLVSWGWRVPFWSGVVVSFSGLYLRNHGGNPLHGHVPVKSAQDDTLENDFNDKAIDEDESPIKLALHRSNWRPLLAATLVPMLWSAGFYIVFVWMAIYMKDMVDNPVPNAFAVNSISLLFSVTLFFPFAGILSDMYGRRLIMAIGGLTMAILSPPLIMLIGRGESLPAFFAQCIMGVSLSLWGAPMCAWLVESFEPEHRLTSVSIGYNIAQAVAGGTAPFFATLLVDEFGPNALGFFITGLSALSLFGLLVVAPKKPIASHEINVDVPNELELSEKQSNQGEIS